MIFLAAVPYQQLLIRSTRLNISNRNWARILVIRILSRICALHEFEGLLYSNPQVFSAWFGESVVTILQAERDSFPSPEHINDNPLTAPSKRIRNCCDGYDKPLHGSLQAIDIGLDSIRQQCQHFNQWLLSPEA